LKIKALRNTFNSNHKLTIESQTYHDLQALHSASCQLNQIISQMMNSLFHTIIQAAFSLSLENPLFYQWPNVNDPFK
jgi:hypothetical protein